MGVVRNGSAPTQERPQLRSGERGTALDSTFYATEFGPTDAYSAGEPSVHQLIRMRSGDPQVRALSTAYCLPLASDDGRIEAHERDSGEKEFCEAVLLASSMEGGMTTPMGDVISQMTSAVDLGYAPFEKVWDARPVGGGPSRFVYHKVAYRPAQTVTIVPDKNGSFDGFKQKGYRADGTALNVRFDPLYSFVYFRGSSRRPLRGESAFSTAYRAHVDKIQTLKLWREALQQFGLGVFVGKHPKNADPAQRRGFFNKIKKIRGAARVLLHPEETLEILQSNGATDQFKEMVRYLDQQMAISVLNQWLMLGTESNTGSWSLSKDHSDFFIQALEADRRDMAQSLTLHLIAPLIRANFGPQAAYPRWVFPPLSETDKTRAFEAWTSLVTAASPHVDGPTFDAIEEKALAAIGIDVKSLREDREKQDGERPHRGGWRQGALGGSAGSPTNKAGVRQLIGALEGMLKEMEGGE